MTRESETLAPDLVQDADSRGLFFARIVDGMKWHRLDPHGSIEEHETVLRPILAAATDCFAYGLEPGTEALAAVADIATKDRGRHRIALAGDPITGREFFWNAHSARRGTIVVLVPRDRTPSQVFRRCQYVALMNNPSAGHTPGAFRYARKCADSEDVVAFCFSRNNGFEWMDVVAGKGKTARLFAEAFDLCQKGQENA
jgi:hypothetical protein